MILNMPKPECRGGYPTYQLEEFLTPEQYTALGKWMYGQTMMICDGRQYDHETKEYVEACGGEAHGVVVYSWDVERWALGLPVID